VRAEVGEVGRQVSLSRARISKACIKIHDGRGKRSSRILSGGGSAGRFRITEGTEHRDKPERHDDLPRGSRS